MKNYLVTTLGLLFFSCLNNSTSTIGDSSSFNGGNQSDQINFSNCNKEYTSKELDSIYLRTIDLMYNDIDRELFFREIEDNKRLLICNDHEGSLLLFGRDYYLGEVGNLSLDSSKILFFRIINSEEFGAEARFYLAEIHLNEKKYDKVSENFEELVKSDYLPGIIEYAYLKITGHGYYFNREISHKKMLDSERGVNLLTYAANIGDVEAQIELGRMYFYGEHGIEVNVDSSRKYLKMAIENDDIWGISGASDNVNEVLDKID